MTERIPFSSNTEFESFLESMDAFFGIPKCEIEYFHISNTLCDGKDITVFDLLLYDHHPPCPHCQCINPSIHGYRTSRVNHSILAGRNAEIYFKRRRYLCPKCRKTFSEDNPFVIRKGKISLETVVNILDDLKKPEVTYTSVARRYKVSPSTVVQIFDTHVDMQRLTLSEYICIDENYAFKDDRSSYICVLLDFKSQEAIDILPNRYKSDLIRYFKSIPMKEREGVKAVSMDMYPIYRDVVRECFSPKTLCVIDRFHLIKEFTTQVDRVRISAQRKAQRERSQYQDKVKELKDRPDFQSQAVQEEYRKISAKLNDASDRYYLLKKFASWMIYKQFDDPVFEINALRKYNSHFQRHLNMYEIRGMLFKVEPLLEEASQFRGLLTELYTYTSPSEGSEFFDSLLSLFKESKAAPIRHFGGTMRRWRTEILNSLIVVERFYEVQPDGDVNIRDRRLHNGVIERKNKQIKILKNVANGYTNFPRFRCRALYVLRNDPAYSLDPVYLTKAIPKEQKND